MWIILERTDKQFCHGIVYFVLGMRMCRIQHSQTHMVQWFLVILCPEAHSVVVQHCWKQLWLWHKYRQIHRLFIWSVIWEGLWFHCWNCLFLCFCLKSLNFCFGLLSYIAFISSLLHLVLLPNNTHFLLIQFAFPQLKLSLHTVLSEKEECLFEFPLLRCLTFVLFFSECKTRFVFLKSAMSSLRAWSGSGTIAAVVLESPLRQYYTTIFPLSPLLQRCPVWSSLTSTFIDVL